MGFHWKTEKTAFKNILNVTSLVVWESLEVHSAESCATSGAEVLIRGW